MLNLITIERSLLLIKLAIHVSLNSHHSRNLREIMRFLSFLLFPYPTLLSCDLLTFILRTFMVCSEYHPKILNFTCCPSKAQNYSSSFFISSSAFCPISSLFNTFIQPRTSFSQLNYLFVLKYSLIGIMLLLYFDLSLLWNNAQHFYPILFIYFNEYFILYSEAQ